MSLKPAFVSIAILYFLSFSSFAYEFSKFETFLEQQNLWELKKTEFPRNLYFNWVSEKQDCIRWPAYSNSPAISFLGLKCYETLIRFGEDKIEKIELCLYSRGDAGEINESEKFDILLNGIFSTIGKWTGQEGTDIPDEKLVNGMTTKGKKWLKDDKTLVMLNWSISEKIKVDSHTSRGLEKVPFRAEFIIMTLTKFDPEAKTAKKPSAHDEKIDIASKKEVKKNVKKDEEGFTYIDGIPMVDQGQKGYCVVATAERIVRYYGLDMTQHDFAQLASSDSKKGTHLEQLMDMFKKIKNKLRLTGKTLFDSNIEGIVNNYNKYANKQKKPTISMVVEKNIIDSQKTFKNIDKDLLKQSRCDMDKRGYKDFSNDIKKYVDLGIPLIWSVQLGIVQENPALPQTAGGHARIISGYNLKTNEMIYSDSWGKGHERKIMKMDDAWMITTGLYIFETRNRD